MNENLKIIVGGMLIDGVKKEPLKKAVIIIEGDKIIDVGTKESIDIPKGEIIDAKNLTIMPGLIDSHVHVTISDILPVGPRKEALQPETITALEAAERLKKLLEIGFTTVLDCGAFEHIDLALRYAIEKRMITGPRLLCCGKAITITGGHADSYFLPPLCIPTKYSFGRVCDGEDEVRKGVREELKAGVDWIKLMHAGGGSLEFVQGVPQLTINEMKAACEETHKVGKKVCVHAQGLQSIKDSIIAGVDSIDHGYEMNIETAEIMKEHNIVHKSTSLAKMSIRKPRSKGQSQPPEIVRRKAGTYPYQLKIKGLQNSMTKGVQIVAATDAEGDDNGVINTMELYHLVYAGMRPMEALKAMTSKAADLLNVKTGRIMKGWQADILIVEGNPLDEIRVLEDKNRIKMVMKSGRIEIKRP
jgi:imidazolonepropionase-like amidohydrolase